MHTRKTRFGSAVLSSKIRFRRMRLPVTSASVARVRVTLCCLEATCLELTEARGELQPHDGTAHVVLAVVTC